MLNIGQIVKPQGIKGEVKIICNGEAERFIHLRSVFIDNLKMNILSITNRNGDLFAKFENINDRNAAELLRGKNVFVNKEDLKPLNEDEIYIDDLLGATVIDETGEKIGELIDIEQYGSADVISIQERNIVFAVPFLKKIFISITNKMVTVNRQEYDNNKITG